jgi:hypothetical protein
MFPPTTVPGMARLTQDEIDRREAKREREMRYPDVTSGAESFWTSCFRKLTQYALDLQPVSAPRREVCCACVDCDGRSEAGAGSKARPM